MDIFQAWAVFPCVTLLLLFAWLPPFHLADPPPGGRAVRVAPLDGLRGLLALAVYFHHVATYRDYITTGEWRLPESPFFIMLGQGGVALFFMITGFLFWGRLIDTAGRPGWLRLYIGRVFRIGPLYLMAVAIMMTIVLARSGFTIQQPQHEFIRDLLKWLLLGLLSPGFNGDPDARLTLAGVTWSLQYEWLFYAALPFTAWFARARRLRMPFVLGGWLVAEFFVLKSNGGGQSAGVALFFSGMLSATLVRTSQLRPLADPVASAVAAALLGLTFTLLPTAYAALPILMLTAAFHLIAAGCSGFGLLTSRPARRLGDISYGIYLLQGLVLALVFAPWAGRGFALASPLQYWLVAALGGLLLVCVALLGYLAIEQPGIRLGRRLARSAARPPPAPRGHGE